MDQQSNQESMQNRSESTNAPSGYSKMLEKSVEILKTKYGDVKFCFDCDGDGDVVKLPAHKDVLAASSSVFNAMFNGELKEKGDVEIKDAPPAVFEEFLHFFYGKPMQLSMENVADVLKLADKYDVEDCLHICIDFLKENSTIDEIVWVLHLAHQFQLEDLKMFCKGKIQRNFEKVCSLFDVMDDGTVRLLSNPDHRFLMEKDVERIYHRIFAMSKSIFSELSSQVNGMCDGCVIPYTLVKESDEQTKVRITDYEIIRFKLTGGNLMLTDLFCSVVLEYYNNQYFSKDFQFEICIEDRSVRPARMIHSQEVESAKHVEHHVKLANPICIYEGHTYFIIMKSTNGIGSDHLCTSKAVLPTEPVELTPTVKISFPCRIPQEKSTHSLISRMYFAPVKPE